jgi:RNA polymerase sigma-70 factor (ECF subfamily)
MDEAALSDRLARGDRRALTALYQLHAGLVLGVALKVLRDRAEAEDVLQETFLEAWRNATRYNPERADLAGWLVTIARSRAVDRLRSRAVATRTLERQGHEPTQAALALDVRVDSERQRQRLRARLSELPEELRMPLLLAWNEGLSQADIAFKTGLPLGTVKTRTRLALMRLSQAVREESVSGAAPG